MKSAKLLPILILVIFTTTSCSFGILANQKLDSPHFSEMKKTTYNSALVKVMQICPNRDETLWSVYDMTNWRQIKTTILNTMKTTKIFKSYTIFHGGPEPKIVGSQVELENYLKSGEDGSFDVKINYFVECSKDTSSWFEKSNMGFLSFASLAMFGIGPFFRNHEAKIKTTISFNNKKETFETINKAKEWKWFLFAFYPESNFQTLSEVPERTAVHDIGTVKRALENALKESFEKILQK